ncbi:hypothetical protein F5X68DRAFT_233436 [Plectosphaerella plurivora]|uniref:Uncharacterized protein n=1 Tax=Plectosphaerella plurivora TaxID=936078 RepID=A0A9P8V920_9PEZI|nr:hypothetical protein F5X68DRAFT_233436 [Plectosphaerella plurivora]
MAALQTPSLRDLFETQDPELRLPRAEIYKFQITEPTERDVQLIQPPTHAALNVPARFASEYPTIPDHVIQRNFWMELGYKVASHFAPDNVHLIPQGILTVGTSPVVAQHCLWQHIHHPVNTVMVAKHPTYRTAPHFLPTLTPLPLHSGRDGQYYDKRRADEEERAKAAETECLGTGPASQMAKRIDRLMRRKRNAQAQEPVTRPGHLAAFPTKPLGSDFASIGNGWPGEGNIRSITLEIMSKPGAITNSVEDFLKGYDTRSPDDQLGRLGMAHNAFGQTAQWLLQEASKHACNCAVQHVSFSDANVTVLVQFFQLPIHALPNERWSVDACGSARAVAILDWRTMSASDILATYIGFYEHAFHTVSREEALL